MLVVEGESLLEPAQGHLEEGRVPPQVMAEVMALQLNRKGFKVCIYKND